MTKEEAEAKYGTKLGDGNLYPDRNCMHRNMGPHELFDCCGGRGWVYAEDGREKYCACPAGMKRKEIE